MTQVSVAVDAKNAHGEGVFWSSEHQLLYWTDIFGERVWTYSPLRGEANSWPTPGKVCCLATRKGRPGHQVVAAFADGFAFFDLQTGARDFIASIDADLQGVRLNDGCTDRQGRLLVGGMNEASSTPIASMWRLDPDLRVTRLFGEIVCANGACFSPDGATMWFADSGRGDIEVFDYDISTGTPSRRRVVARTEAPGVPDGSCVDEDGYVWNAVWEGYRVDRYAPDGRWDRTIQVPVKKPTCCAFGGEDLATLFITSSQLEESAESLREQPLAGALFSFKPGVRGVAEASFGG